MRSNFSILLACLLTGQVWAQSQSAMGLCDQPLPLEQTRKLSAQWLECDAGSAEVVRTPRKIENYEQWVAFEAARNRKAMQDLRLQEVAPQWSTDLTYPVVEKWSWTSIHYNDIDTCGYDPIYLTTVNAGNDSAYNDSRQFEKQALTRPIYKNVEVCDPEPDSSSVGSTSTGSSSSGSGKNSTETDHRETEGSFSGSNTRPAPGGGSYGDKFRKNGNSSTLPSTETKKPPRRPSSTNCHSERQYQGEETYAYKIFSKRPRTCEVGRTGSRLCENQSMKLNIKFQKPEASWQPCTQNNQTNCDKNYHDILPNKYDLLPGEFEKIYFVSNSSPGPEIKPRIEIDKNLAWNNYQVQVPQNIRCQFRAKPEVNIEIKTLSRIVKKSPNALAYPVGADGNPLSIQKVLPANQYSVAQGFAYGRPYEIKLQDTSNKEIMAAARQSRNFKTEFKISGDNKVLTDSVDKVGTSQNMGFWKDTQFKVSLIEVRSIGRDVRFSNDLKTRSAEVQTTGSNITIPLEAEKGVKSLYLARTTNPLNTLLVQFLGATDTHLTPGNNYEYRISMYQRGLPFYKYENECQGNSEACDFKEGNDKLYSTELVLKFQASRDVDERTFGEKLQDWWRAPLWKKF